MLDRHEVAGIGSRKTGSTAGFGGGSLGSAGVLASWTATVRAAAASAGGLRRARATATEIPIARQVDQQRDSQEALHRSSLTHAILPSQPISLSVAAIGPLNLISVRQLRAPQTPATRSFPRAATARRAARSARTRNSTGLSLRVFAVNLNDVSFAIGFSANRCRPPPRTDRHAGELQPGIVGVSRAGVFSVGDSGFRTVACRPLRTLVHLQDGRTDLANPPRTRQTP